jgi:uncharacterized protein YdhG (YjbR/CyaY superfamily)
MKNPKDVDEYISNFPVEVQQLLEQVRQTIKLVAPQAEEVISYSMPAFKLNGILVWYAAYTKHIGFYPKTSAIEAFKKEISIYKSAKGSVQFPLDNPLPLNLISEMVKFRINENLQNVKSKRK